MEILMLEIKVSRRGIDPDYELMAESALFKALIILAVKFYNMKVDVWSTLFTHLGWPSSVNQDKLFSSLALKCWRDVIVLNVLYQFCLDRDVSQLKVYWGETCAWPISFHCQFP